MNQTPPPEPPPSPRPAKRRPKRKEMNRKTELILRALSGQITATEAAQELGISRKTYYEWEQRLLAGVMEAMEPKEPGRPRQEHNAQVEALQKKVERLEKQVESARQDQNIRRLLDAMREVETKKKRIGPANPPHHGQPET